MFNTDQYGIPKIPVNSHQFPEENCHGWVYIRVVVPNFQTDPYSTYNKDVERVIRHGPVGLCFWFGGPVSGLYGRCDFDFFWYIYIDVDYIVYTITMPYMQLYFPDISGMCTPWVVPLENHHCRRTSS